MPLHGGVGPPTGTPALPGDPFFNFPRAGVFLSRNSDGTINDQVIPDINNPNNVQAFNSGAIGQPSEEQIWAFEARQIAADIDLMVALIQKMQIVVPSDRPDWSSGAKTLIAAALDVQKAAGQLCQKTAHPKPPKP